MSFIDVLSKATLDLSASPEAKRLAGKIFVLKLEDKSYTLRFSNDGKPEVSEGEAQSPTSTITSTSQVMLEIIQGKRDPIQAFFTGKVKVSGDLMAVQQLVNALKKRS